jgi:hypothetical protein
MVKVFVVSFERGGVRVFHPESLSAAQAQQMGRCLGAARMKPRVHKLLLTKEEAEKAIAKKIISLRIGVK